MDRCGEPTRFMMNWCNGRLIKIVSIFVLLLSILPFQTSPAHAQDEITWLLDQINALRASVGLSPYILNGTLSIAAQSHSQWMADTGMVSHDEPNGSTPKSRAAGLGYTGTIVSENIYGGSTAKASDAWNFWINSSIHYNGLTHQLFNEVGIGIGQGAYGQFYTLVFGNGGTTQSAPPKPTEAPAQAAPVEQPEQPQSEILPSVIEATATPPTQLWMTWTPSATIATHTPTMTWTPTFTWTPSPSITLVPATPTPVSLSVIAASVPTLVPTVTPTEMLVALAPQRPTRQIMAAKTNPEKKSDSRQTWLIVLLGLINQWC